MLQGVDLDASLPSAFLFSQISSMSELSVKSTFHTICAVFVDMPAFGLLLAFPSTTVADGGVVSTAGNCRAAAGGGVSSMSNITSFIIIVHFVN